MAVLYAAKKYNIPGLVEASLQIPISELRNVFLACAQARLFDLEDFASKCLHYICQNAAQLFESNDFLQIDQKMLCVLLDSDRLLLSNEFEIWKAAIRWADEKCRQNGTKNSSGNRRLQLGLALFKIRFPNINEEDFAEFVVPSGVLTEKEVIGVYQFNSHPNLYRPSKEGHLLCKLKNYRNLHEKPFGVNAQIKKKNESTDKNEKWLGIYLMCDSPKKDKNWNCKCSANYRIISQKSGVRDYERGDFTSEDTFNSEANSWGHANFISFAELLNPNEDLYNQNEDKVTLAIDVIVKEQKRNDKS
ncbi:hypothetical protein niasHT_006340 [Heterodera trifolii]|uniref:BACK domain-containing protein n=1 Tax=Heterodera trifolii TaxID=157864 RepID=A0ABD2M4K9_9BILA